MPDGFVLHCQVKIKNDEQRGDHNRITVHLDYFPKKCINLLTKGEGFGLVGGISLSDKSKCDEYLDYVIQKHQKFLKNGGVFIVPLPSLIIIDQSNYSKFIFNN